MKAFFFSFDVTIHGASTSNEITLVGDHTKVVYIQWASRQNSDIQTTIDIQLCFKGYKWLFHLMLRLHVSSTSNEITLVGNHIRSGIVTSLTL